MLAVALQPVLRFQVLQVYYYNTLTNESSWEKPKDYAGDVSKASAQLTPVSTQPVKGTEWSEVVCADGRKYYFNGSTQVRQSIADLPVLQNMHLVQSVKHAARCLSGAGSNLCRFGCINEMMSGVKGCCQMVCVALQETSWTAPPEVKAVLGKKAQVVSEPLSAQLSRPHCKKCI